MSPKAIRGLSNFIADVKACSSKEAEELRVQKEIAKIGARLANPRLLNGYERRKCVWKLVYCYMLGYDISFGQIEAVNLVSSAKYSEKAAGYIACSMLLLDNTEILGLLINLVKVDVRSSCESIAALGLNFLANVATDQMIEMTLDDVQHLCNPSVRVSPYIRKKAYLALLRFARRRPDLVTPQHWAASLAQGLTPVAEAGLLTALASLILGVVEISAHGWEVVVQPCCNLLWRIHAGDVPTKGMHNRVPVPWLQVRLLRILQYFPPPLNTPESMKTMTEFLRNIVSHSPMLPKALPTTNRRRRPKDLQIDISRYHSEHAIFFEAVNVVLAYSEHLDISVKRHAASALNSIGLAVDADVRYLRLEAMSRLAVDPDVVTTLQKNMEPIIAQLSEADDSIRRQALNLLFSVCGSQTWQLVVDELLGMLKTTSDPVMQEDLIIKIAILVEKHAPDFTWYIDTVFTMMEYAPAAVTDDVWHRVVQILSGDGDENERLQVYAARKAHDALADTYADEVLVRMGAYILGEFGHLIQEEAPGHVQLSVLHRHFGRVTASTRAILLLAYAKMFNVHDDIADQILSILEDQTDNVDTEVQQRAVELTQLCQLEPKQLETILACMPAYPLATLHSSALIRRLKFHTPKRALTRGTLEDPRSYKVEAAPSLSSASSEEKDNEEQTASNATSDAATTPSHDDAVSQEVSSSSASRKSSSRSASSESDEEDETLQRLSLPSVDPSNFVALWRRLCIVAEGPLIITPNLRIDVKHQYRDHVGRLLFLISNCSPQHVQLQQIQIEPSTGLRVTIRSSPAPGTSLGPGEQVKQAIETSLLEPFTTPPRYAIRILAMGQTTPSQHVSAFPTILTSFISPATLTPAQFKKFWQEAATKSGSGTVDAVTVSTLHPALGYTTPEAAVTAYLTEAFHFECQKVERSLCGSGILHSAMGDSNQGTKVPCLVKIDFDTATSRVMVAVRCAKSTAALPLLHILTSYILAPQQRQSPTAAARQQPVPAAPSYPSQTSSATTPAFPVH